MICLKCGKETKIKSTKPEGFTTECPCFVETNNFKNNENKSTDQWKDKRMIIRNESNSKIEIVTAEGRKLRITEDLKGIMISFNGNVIFPIGDGE